MSTASLFPKRIWMYWENKPGSSKPPYLELCFDSINCHKGDFELVLLDEKSVTDYVNVPKKVRQLEEIAHRADFIRFQLLRQYGGVWLDADVILTRDISASVFPYIDDYDFVGYGREPGKPSINFMACRKGCELIGRHAEAMERVLEKKRAGLFNRKLKLQWTEIGHDILWDLAKDYPYYHHELRRVAPVFWKDWKLFFQTDLEPEQYLGADNLMVMLYNDFMYRPLKDTSASNLLEGNTLLSKVFRRALQK